jgi:hypothetical protein
VPQFKGIKAKDDLAAWVKGLASQNNCFLGSKKTGAGDGNRTHVSIPTPQ